MSILKVDPQALTALKSFKLPAEVPFGSVMAPVMIECDYDNGTWSDLVLKPYGPLQLDPTCKTLHYAQEIFEGLKAYKTEGRGPFLFRPNENYKRFNFSARRMAMPEIPENIFMAAVRGMVAHCAGFIPEGSGDSLYVRPFMFATDNNLGIKPSQKFKFMVLASPSGSYFASGTVSVEIEREAIRASQGGVGCAKTGGNYAASLLSMIKAKEKGYDQVLWLDGQTKTYIEELSGMNFFAIYGQTLVTPKLSGTILDGITRKSIIELAKHKGHKVREENIAIDNLIEDIKRKECTEAFACGTAVIITPIASLGEADGTRYQLTYQEGPTAMQLRQSLLDLQEGRSDDPFGWRVSIEAAVL